MKRMIAFVASATLSLAFAICSVRGFCLQMEISLEQKIAKADLIVLGRVVDIKCGWTEPKTIPHTFVSVSIEEIIKGESTGDEITIMLPGGTVDNQTAIVAVNLPTFHKRERVLVFLLHDPKSDNFIVVHGVSGKYSISPKDDVASISKTLPEFLNEIRQYIHE